MENICIKSLMTVSVVVSQKKFFFLHVTSSQLSTTEILQK